MRMGDPVMAREDAREFFRGGRPRRVRRGVLGGEEREWKEV